MVESYQSVIRNAIDGDPFDWPPSEIVEEKMQYINPRSRALEISFEFVLDKSCTINAAQSE